MTPTTAWWPGQRPEEVRETLAICKQFLADNNDGSGGLGCLCDALATC